VTCSVDFTTAAARQVRKLPHPARDRILDVLDDVLIVTVVRAAHRREVYDR